MAVETPAQYHFTYRAFDAVTGDLQQGDLLSKTSDLLNVIQAVHPHYLQSDYTHFLVLTQSCDLVRRDGKPCDARYITLAAVRPLTLVIEREIRRYQQDLDIAGGICRMGARFRLEQFLHSLLNNNIPEYFYLHEEPGVGLNTSQCAFLRLSIAIRSSEHYETCAKARLVSLQEVFQAKLGWLVGNIYSRVGTEDWVPRYRTTAEFETNIGELLNSACKWVEDERLKAARAAATPALLAQGREAIRTHVESVAVPNRRAVVLDRAISITNDVLSGRPGGALTSEEERKVRTRLNNDPDFARLVKGPA